MPATPTISRRSFLGLLAAASAARLVPAFIPPREPYVAAGQVVGYCGLNLHPAPTFTGGAILHEVHPWDGLGYPCTVMNQAFGSAYAPMPHRFYDFDLYVGHRDIPYGFWHNQLNRDRYPNVQAWLREQRLGESPDVMRERMRVARFDRDTRNWPALYVRGEAGALI